MTSYKRRAHRIKPKKNIAKSYGFWYFIIFLIVAGATCYFFFFYDYFQVKSIQISGNEKITTEQLNSIVGATVHKKFLFFPTKSIFLVDEGDIVKQVLNISPIIGSAQIRKNLPSSITLSITERKPAVVLCQLQNKADSCYFVDNNGVAFENTDNKNGVLPIVRQADNLAITLGQPAIKKEVVQYVMNTNSELSTKFSITVQSANIVSEDRMDIKTSEGWEVYFNLGEDVNLEIQKLVLLLDKELSGANREGLKYIDLQYKDRAYYK